MTRFSFLALVGALAASSMVSAAPVNIASAELTARNIDPAQELSYQHWARRELNEASDNTRSIIFARDDKHDAVDESRKEKKEKEEHRKERKPVPGFDPEAFRSSLNAKLHGSTTTHSSTTTTGTSTSSTTMPKPTTTTKSTSTSTSTSTTSTHGPQKTPGVFDPVAFRASLSAKLHAQQTSVNGQLNKQMTGLKNSMESMRASNSAFAASVTKHHKTIAMPAATAGACDGTLINGQCCKSRIVIDNKCYASDDKGSDKPIPGKTVTITSSNTKIVNGKVVDSHDGKHHHNGTSTTTTGTSTTGTSTSASSTSTSSTSGTSTSAQPAATPTKSKAQLKEEKAKAKADIKQKKTDYKKAKGQDKTKAKAELQKAVDNSKHVDEEIKDTKKAAKENKNAAKNEKKPAQVLPSKLNLKKTSGALSDMANASGFYPAVTAAIFGAIAVVTL